MEAKKQDEKLRAENGMRCGYTTGSCAAAAAKAAVQMLLRQKDVGQVSIWTPKGKTLHLSIEQPSFSKDEACCFIRKDAGDDPDVTDGMLIGAKVRKNRDGGIHIDGGKGIGRVTKPGLDQPVGNAAINHVPRQMIREAVQSACEEEEWDGGIDVVVLAPEGEERAQKTFNPRLGIVGGISILGTTGIVEPMSEKALVESIHLEMRQAWSLGAAYELLVPGNYGENFVKDVLKSKQRPVQFSNYVGEAVDYALRLHLKGVLFAAHIGKFIKVSGGIMNTHSHFADCRMELLAVAAIREHIPLEILEKILSCLTTEEALDYIEQSGKAEAVYRNILERILFYLDKRAKGQLEIGVILYSSEKGMLARSENAQALLEKCQGNGA